MDTANQSDCSGSFPNGLYPELNNVTRMTTPQDFLAECQHRRRFGLPALHPQTFSQWIPAYQQGLYPHRPAQNEMGWELFARLHPVPLNEETQERLLVTIQNSDRFRKALNAVLNRKGSPCR